MKSIKLVFILTIILFIFSCSKKDNPIREREEQSIIQTRYSNGNVPQEMLDLLHLDTDAKSFILNVETQNSSKKSYSMLSTVKGNTSPLAVSFDGVDYICDDFYYESSKDKSICRLKNNMSSIFGKNYSCNLSNTEVLFDSNTSSDNWLYIPKEIEADFSSFLQNAEISWNSDSENTKGIYLILEYNPDTQRNQNLIPHENLLRTIHLPDSGQYTLSDEDLEGFPQGVSLTFYLARAGYNLIVNEDHDYSIAAVTISRADFSL